VSKGWRWFLLVSLVCGLFLRGVALENMEYKEDEEYHFTQSQVVGQIRPWPTVGIPSGVYLVNPGMSVWVFAALARLVRADDPVELARGIGWFAVFGMALVIPFAALFVRREEREPWFWAFALAMVNPILVLYHRKLWPEGFLPFFTMLLWMGWWRRNTRLGAFAWGFAGALVGQVHMSGFFLAGALFAWTALFDRYRDETRWRPWLAGSVLGALPLLPWLGWVLSRPAGGQVSAGFRETIQLKFWHFWFSDPLGLHLGNALGIHRGGSHLAQLSDFARYPLWHGAPTYLVGAMHAVLLLLGVLILAVGAMRVWRGRWRKLLFGSETSFALGSAMIGFGSLLTATGVMIRRYYLCVSYPLEFVWLARTAELTRRGRWVLGLVWVAQLLISASFVWYVHVNSGSEQGDYGKAYHREMEERGVLGPAN
jgi:4-amino-4-deoxy-L-arabinose transferase-like glycosyltransferase